MKNMYYFLIILFMSMLSGCSNKNILMPGQEYSDCYVANDNNGVCGNPMYLYKYQNEIKALPPHPGITYTINEKGVIREKDSGKIIEAGRGRQFQKSSVAANNLAVKNRSLVIQNYTKMVPIRDLGYIRKVWLAPYTNVNGDLVDAHDIYLVIKKPKWIVGEDFPKRVQSGTVVPSLLTTKIVNDRQQNPNYEDIKAIKNYVNSTKKQQKIAQYEKNILKYINTKDKK